MRFDAGTMGQEGMKKTQKRKFVLLGTTWVRSPDTARPRYATNLAPHNSILDPYSTPFRIQSLSMLIGIEYDCVVWKYAFENYRLKRYIMNTYEVIIR